MNGGVSILRLSRQLQKLKDSDTYARDRGLTANEKKFCYEYAHNLDVKLSAKKCGLSWQNGYKMIKRARVLDFVDYLKEVNGLASLEHEAERLKGQRVIWSQANMRDYFDENNKFVGFENLTQAQASCIKKFKVKPTKLGNEYQIELYDADRSNELLARPHGLFNEIKVDLSLLELISPEDIEKLRIKYGWDFDESDT